MTHDNGGWTLMITSATNQGWTKDNVKSRYVLMWRCSVPRSCFKQNLVNICFRSLLSPLFITICSLNAKYLNRLFFTIYLLGLFLAMILRQIYWTCQYVLINSYNCLFSHLCRTSSYTFCFHLLSCQLLFCPLIEEMQQILL